MIQELVRREKAPIGLSFDGDGDRIIAVDELGNIVDGDHILAICFLFERKGKVKEQYPSRYHNDQHGIRFIFTGEGY